MIVQKICEVCHKPFVLIRGNQKYCGPECFAARRNEKQREAYRANEKNAGRKNRLCRECGEMFVSTSNSSVFCGMVCSRKFRWRGIKRDETRLQKSLRASRVSSARRQDRRWVEIFARHGDACADCHQTYPRCVYDLHHITNAKRHALDHAGYVIKNGTDVAFDRLLKSTIVLCANCHRLRHNTGRPYEAPDNDWGDL